MAVGAGPYAAGHDLPRLGHLRARWGRSHVQRAESPLGAVSRLHTDGSVTVRTQRRDVTLSAHQQAGDLLHANAITTHRAQGIAAPACLVLADTEP